MAVTKEHLDIALKTWAEAHEKALLEQLAWAEVCNSYGVLIKSLHSNGLSFSQAKTEFDRLSVSHRGALLAAWENMDVCCSDYQMLLELFNAQ